MRESRGIGTRLYSALFEAISTEDIHRILAGYVLPNPASAALHEHFGFKLVGVFSENGRKLDRHWDVAWTERPFAPVVDLSELCWQGFTATGFAKSLKKIRAANGRPETCCSPS
jgi:hypothetical protein